MSRLRSVARVCSRLAVTLSAATGCSVFEGPSDRIIALELVSPAVDTVAAGDTLRLYARALAANGDTVSDAAIIWAILDTGTVGILLVDSAGVVAGRLTGNWHVQARVETIRSDPITVTVQPGTTATLTHAGLPDSMAPGTAASDTVTARDAFGNVAASYAGTVHFTSSDTAAALPADYPFSVADGGRHVFTGLILSTPGTQSVTVSDVAQGSLTATQIITVTQASGSGTRSQ